MQERKATRPSDVLSGAGFFSRLMFSWAWPLLKLGFQRPLQDLDLPALPKEETSAYQRKIIEDLFQEATTTTNNNNNNKAATTTTKKETETGDKSRLAKALLWYYLRSNRKAQIILAINMAARIGQALTLGLLMEQFGSHNNSEDRGGEDADLKETNIGNNIDPKQGYWYASLLVLCSLIVVPTKQHQFFETYRFGYQLRIALVASIYAKTLRLPSLGGRTVTSGHLTNLASNDVERFLLTAVESNFLLLGPIEAIAILVVGIGVLGPVFAAGYALLLVLVPIQISFGKLFVYYRSRIASITDRRVGLVSQTVTGARVMKMNGWENGLQQRILRIRHKEEIVELQKAAKYRAINDAMYYFSSVVISLFVFVLKVVVFDEQLTPKTVFATLTLMNNVQFTLTKHMPNAIMGLSECYVSCQRIQAFLELPEQEALVHNAASNDECDQNDDNPEFVLRLSNVTCHWDSNHASSTTVPKNMLLPSKVALCDISMTLRREKLYCVIGKVGSGKSALLQTLAGELPVSCGTVNRKYRSLAYATQDPWIMDGSVRENVIMGLAFEEDWYQTVVSVCGLGPDIQGFVHGDRTVVGDRGVQCSGGQKARIGLARALYRDAEVLLLDDPLSAVDAKVARSIYYSAIQDLAIQRRKKCVVLVTHQHQFVGDSAVRCILLDNGQLLCAGSFAECVEASNGEISDAMQTNKAEETPALENSTSTDDSNAMKNNKGRTDKNAQNEEQNENYAEIRDAAQSEKRVVGIVRLSTWIAYGNAVGGVFVCLFFFFTFAATQSCLLLNIVQIGNWAARPAEEQRSLFWLGLNASLTSGVVVLAIFRARLSYFLFINASKRLHDFMLQTVLRAKIEFFDTNPLGRILNRFSADVGITDELLPLTIYDFLVAFFMVMGGIATAIVGLPFILVVLPFLFLYFIRLRLIFVSTTRELKRLEGIARSPIFAMISESLNGIATIRSNEKLDYFKSKFEEVHNSHTRALFCFASSSRWFANQLDFLAFILLSAASLLAVLVHVQGWFEVDPAILGLALTMLIQIATQNFPWMVRQSAEVTNQMVSVERILGFGNLPQEAPPKTDIDNEKESWPEETSIVVKNLKVRYRPNLPPALNGVSFRIESGQRVGVVGRTGSGKTSLVQALFRILEAEEGSVEIGQVDISNLGLQKLRTSMAVIPQSPVLFSGCTIRENLDPFGKYDEPRILESIEAVQMLEAIGDLPRGIDTQVAEGGSNFSVGQRQLLCLARAVLLQNRILVLDEPTANVDMKTDQLLQKTLRETFDGATILSVAHRLDTIIDYDRVLVLGNGRVLEFGSPAELLSRGEGYFSSMVNSTGEAMSKILRQKAKKALK